MLYTLRIKYIIFFFLLLIVGYSQLIAQLSELTFSHITVEDGLMSNAVRVLLQDRKGFIWIGSEGGLNRYDGSSMKSYVPEINNPESIPYDAVSDMIEDEKGNIWLTAYTTSICRYDPLKDVFQEYSLPENLASPISKIYEDKRGNIWVGTWDRGILRFNTEQESFENFPASFPKNALGVPINAIEEDSFGYLWFGTKNGLHRFSWEDSSFKYYSLKGNEMLELQKIATSVSSIFEDSQKTLWIGGGGGSIKGFLGKYNRARDSLILFSTNGMVGSFNESGQNLLWLATTDGLEIFNLRLESSINPASIPELPTIHANTGQIDDILFDREDNIWLGSINEGIYFGTHSNKPFHIYKHPFKTLRNNITRSIYESSDGKIWLAMGFQPIKFDPVKQEFDEYIYPPPTFLLTGDSKGWIWGGSFDAGVFKFYPPQKTIYSYYPDSAQVKGFALINNFDIKWVGDIESKQAPFLISDKNDVIWVQIRGYGYYYLDSVSNSFKHYPLYDPQKGVELGKSSRIMFEDRMGNLWIGIEEGLVKIIPDRSSYSLESLPFQVNEVRHEDTEGNLWGNSLYGLFRYHPDTKQARVYTIKDGLPNNIILGIEEDDHQNLWISTYKGLSKYNLKTEEFQNYFQKDGLPSNQFHSNASLKTKNGEIYFGSYNGFVRFHPDSIQINTHVPPVIITEIRINNEEVPIANTSGDTLGYASPLKQNISYLKEIELDYWQKDLSFEFAALNYFRPEKNQYKYKLENYDEAWLETDASRPYATYTNLSPGTYTLRVLGSNNDGVWNNEGTSLKITISPPFWLTIWAYIMYTILVLALLYGIYRYQRRRWQLQTQLQLEQEKATRFKELDNFKSRFYTNITHEFRTPLTVIKGMASQIKEDQNIKTLIQRNSHRLLNMVNQLLDLSKLETNSLTIDWVQGDIISYLKYLTESCHSLAASKSLNLAFFSTQERLVMDYDENKLQQILVNLLSNAIKFTPEYGSVKVIATPAQEKDSNYLALMVKDTGKGIPKDKLPHIFNRFYQIDDSSTRKGEGSGIGLALVKELVQLFKGRIEVESEVNKGSEFRVYLPIQQKALEAAKITENTQIASGINGEISSSELVLPQGSSDEKPLVLIIEDNADVAEYIFSCLKQDYTLQAAQNGKEGVAKALEIIPDVILCDVMMPEMDGFEVCERLKSDKLTSHIPIVLLTAKATQEDKVAGLSYGADAYLTKPFDKEELLVRLHNLTLLSKRLQQKLVDSAPSDEEQSPLEKQEAAFLQEVNEIITVNLDNELFNTNQLCRAIGMSRTQLHRKLKALTDQSTANYIRTVRLKKAKSLLQTTDQPIGDIAIQVGFKDF